MRCWGRKKVSCPDFKVSSTFCDSLRLSESRSVKQSLPPIKNAQISLKPPLADEDNPKINPFVMPPPSEVFAVRERERLKQREERAKERTLKVHEKMTYSTRRNSKLAGLRKQVLTPDPTSGDSALRKDSSRQDDTQFLLASTKDRCLEKEDLRNYVGRKKEMFLVQYSLGVKREEIQKLEEIAHAEEKKLEAAEKYLEQSATMFDDFLKENDKNAVEAIKMYDDYLYCCNTLLFVCLFVCLFVYRAEAATKAKLEKVAEIKKLNAHLIAMKK